jgi:two-component system, NtrC family, sensor histidine kinase HydH
MLVFVYVLSQTILSSRLLDMYELAGRLTVLTVLSFSLTGIHWVLVQLVPGLFFLPSVVAAMVLLLITEPVRQKVEQQISQVFFRERHELETTIQSLRRQLANVLSVDDLVQRVVEALEASRRLTHASIYLLDAEGTSYELRGHAGAPPVRRIRAATARPFLDRLRRDGALVLEALERERDERRELGEHREAETLREIQSAMESMHASVAVALQGEHEAYGILCVRDERLKDAFSPEEVQLLVGLAAQASIAVENARLYQRMKDRDRLAALGEMSAGLAHEIRNPLGSIKASAQFLAESPAGDNEFLGIIVEEVDRLNRVVGSFLDYARPQGAPQGDTIDVNATVRRTFQLLSPQLSDKVDVRLELEPDLPPVRVDAERLKQVIINLSLNAVQAMDGRGVVHVTTTLSERALRPGSRSVELSVRDTGPGLPERVRANLFVPFVTTKEGGTGLGLAISQRIVAAAGGAIEVRSTPGVGTTFIVRLPEATGDTLELARRSSNPELVVTGEGDPESVPAGEPASGTA